MVSCSNKPGPAYFNKFMFKHLHFTFYTGIFEISSPPASDGCLGSRGPLACRVRRRGLATCYTIAF